MTVIIGYTNFELAERPNHSMVLFLFGPAWVKIYVKIIQMEANQWKMAIEIVDFPIKNGDFPWQNVNVHQRVLELTLHVWITLDPCFVYSNYFMMTKQAFCSLLNGCAGDSPSCKLHEKCRFRPFTYHSIRINLPSLKQSYPMFVAKISLSVLISVVFQNTRALPCVRWSNPHFLNLVHIFTNSIMLEHVLDISISRSHIIHRSLEYPR